MPLSKFHADCANCSVRRACPAGAVGSADIERVQSIVYVRRTVRRGEALFAAGDACDAVYAAWRGFFKTVLVNR
ncbi:MAG: transcriptional regulator, partial [Betaproteobacteria bacterium]